MQFPPLFKDKQFYKSLFTLAVPIMVQNLIASLVNMLDTIMIGRLGTVEIAAVGLANQVFFLYQLALFGVFSGGAIFTAQFWGKRDIAGIRKNAGLGIAFGLVVSVLFTAASALFPQAILSFYSRDPAVIEKGALYLRTLSPSFIPLALGSVFMFTLRAVEKVRLATAAAVVALSMNAALNYIFIFGFGPVPAMGVKGAAIATDISRYTEMAIMVIASYVKRYPCAGTLKEFFAFDRSYVARYLRVAFPVMCNEVLWSTGITLQNVILARTNTDAIAAFNIVNTVSQLTWVVFMGLGNGVGVMVGNKIGAGDEQGARDSASRIIRFAPLLAAGAGLILLPVSRFILPFAFNISAGAMQAAFDMFIILVVSYPFKAFNLSMIIGICRPGGDTVFCAIYDNFFLWLFALPLAALAAAYFHVPVPIIYLCLMIEEPLKACVGLWRFLSGKWLHNVIE